MATDITDTQALRARRYGQIGQLIASQAETITELWYQRLLRDQDGTPPSHRAEMRDHLPEFLRALGNGLAGSDADLPWFGHVAGQHGEQRWRVGWELAEVVRDYQILRVVLLEYLPQQLQRTLESVEILGICVWLDDAVTASVVTYVNHQQLNLRETQDHLRKRNSSLESMIFERTDESEQRAERITELIGELTQVQQRERQRLSRLLHDDLQQLLVAAKMMLTQFGNQPDQVSESGSYSALELLDQAISAARSVSVELYPPMLAEADLTKTISWLAGHFQRTYGLSVELQTDHAEGNRAELSVFVFDCVRELLFNVVKHAQVDQAYVTVLRHDETLQVAVHDEGVGFDYDQSHLNFGLSDVRRRVLLLGGDFFVDAAPGKGCHVTIAVPFI